jgi:hypothetical protein
MRCTMVAVDSDGAPVPGEAEMYMDVTEQMVMDEARRMLERTPSATKIRIKHGNGTVTEYPDA